MDSQQAIAVLKGLLDKPSLTPEEKEAVTAAIGMLSWTQLAENQMKSFAARREKSAEWSGAPEADKEKG